MHFGHRPAIFTILSTSHYRHLAVICYLMLCRACSRQKEGQCCKGDNLGSSSFIPKPRTRVDRRTVQHNVSRAFPLLKMKQHPFLQWQHDHVQNTLKPQQKQQHKITIVVYLRLSQKQKVTSSKTSDASLMQGSVPVTCKVSLSIHFLPSSSLSTTPRYREKEWCS